ncbi:MAG: alcohol dehydrogenase catalytic domain-containing protein [Gemmatimonadaceae bacterium]
MKAVQIVEIGKPLELREVTRPEPGAGEILVRVLTAGICHSDAHYRAGTASVGFLPITPGHEIAGVIEKLGASADGVAVGDRVALHYLFTCGRCEYCARGLEQFCRHGQMVGKHVNGGYAEYVVAPARNAIAIAEGVTMAAAAIMMCSTATAFHALRKARMVAGDSVAVFGAGGLGMSAIQLARACGAADVFAVDIDPAKLEAAARYGARAIDATRGAPEQQLRDQTGGRGVDVALEFAGLPVTQEQAVASLAVQGRAAMAGIAGAPFAVSSYHGLINREAEVVGVSDHLRHELVTLMDFARRGLLDLESVITQRLALDAEPINRCLDALAGFRGRTRSVIVME